MEKTIYCPICKRKVGNYDGKATINQMYRCKKCNKKIVYYTDTGETKAKIEFAKEVSKDYKLDIKPVEVNKNLTSKNVKYVVDINVLENGQIVKINDTKMKIRIALPEDLKGFNKYEVVYISNDEIKETIPAIVEDGYIVFETSHLSQYGIVATNVEEKTEQTKNETNNPKTGDNIILYVAIAGVSLAGLATMIVVKKRRNK